MNVMLERGGKPVRREGSDPGPAEGYRAWRAPKTELDKAVARFMDAERGGMPRGEAFRSATKGWSSAKAPSFSDALLAAERSATVPLLSGDLRNAKQEETNTKLEQNPRITAALRAFNERVGERGSDPEEAFRYVSKEHRLSEAEQVRFAESALRAFTRRDMDEKEDVSKKQEAPDALPPKESTETRLIPQEEAIERLQDSARYAELAEEIGTRLKRRGARIRVNDDGTADILAAAQEDKRPKGGGRRRR